MAIQRLDLKTARYDRLAASVLIDGRGCVVEVALDALEALNRRRLAPEEAVAKAVEAAKRLAALATRLPADDGKITITRSILMGEGLYEERPQEEQGS
ncbi:MAG: hypothetical protein BroJett030_04940 [Alphaproteobacteria bacterium]|nr:MAG: hypothetical protein BroJett030_04940 [Alphaproteobacteria bacterium]